MNVSAQETSRSSSQPVRWMIYGANGYTGELIAREAARRGLKPVLAGRKRASVEGLARALGLEGCSFGLDDPELLFERLQGFHVVLNCAGPFSATALPMMRACLRARVHYLDINGEIDVFEQAQALDAKARAAEVVLCPGVGFDVIPTDCVAAALWTALPDATHLSLGFDSQSGLSPGTAKTSVEGLAQGAKVRRNGKIISVPLAGNARRIDFGDGEKQAFTIPWGDVSTAFHTTGIPNIEVYMPASPQLVAIAKSTICMRPLLGVSWVQKLIKSCITGAIKGPSKESRDKMVSFVWGEAVNDRGQKKVARIRTANGYSLTIDGSLAVVDHLMRAVPTGGCYTPAKLVGLDFVSRLPGSGLLQIV